MTVEEFNDKYKDYLEEGYYGLEINNRGIINILDIAFSQACTLPNFSYSQIKLKFGMARVYLSSDFLELSSKLEQQINNIIKRMKTKFIIVEWPESQSYICEDGFNDNSCLINDESWLDQYGSSCYFVNEKWKQKIDEKIYRKTDI